MRVRVRVHVRVRVCMCMRACVYMCEREHVCVHIKEKERLIYRPVPIIQLVASSLFWEDADIVPTGLVADAHQQILGWPFQQIVQVISDAPLHLICVSCFDIQLL